MQYLEKLDQNCIFAYIPELESLFGTVSLLCGESASSVCMDIYGQERINSWTRKYNFLFEVCRAIKPVVFINLFDFLLDMDIEMFSMDCFRSMLLEMPVEAFVWRLFDLQFVRGADKERLQRAITEDGAMDEACGWVSESCSSILAFSAFLRQRERFVMEFFSLAEELRTKELQTVLGEYQPKIEQMLEEFRMGLEKTDPLSISEEKMGKTFRNRGPYSEFVFLPSYLMPMRACRYFNIEGERKRQMLFLTLRSKERSQKETVAVLKAVADGARYQILALLAKEGPMRGLDIAKKVSLATSTVSHHMEQLKECGLITEEPVKSSKYYGINKQSVKLLLAEMEKDFGTSQK